MLEKLGRAELIIILTRYHNLFPLASILGRPPLPLLVCEAANVLHDLLVGEDGRGDLIVVRVETDHVLVLDLQIVGRLVHT